MTEIKVGQAKVTDGLFSSTGELIGESKRASKENKHGLLSGQSLTCLIANLESRLFIEANGNEPTTSALSLSHSI